MRNSSEVGKLIEMIELFINGDDRSIEIANSIEILLDELFPEVDAIQDIVTDFACYKPGGGEYFI